MICLLEAEKYAMITISKTLAQSTPKLAAVMKVKKCKQLLVCDITYISVGDKFGYLMLITDAIYVKSWL